MHGAGACIMCPSACNNVKAVKAVNADINVDVNTSLPLAAAEPAFSPLLLRSVVGDLGRTAVWLAACPPHGNRSARLSRSRAFDGCTGISEGLDPSRWGTIRGRLFVRSQRDGMGWES